MLILLAGLCSVIVFLPPEGQIAVPLHAAIELLLGEAAFMLPLSLALVGFVLIVQRLRPSVVIPRQRLIGVGLVALGVLGGEHLLNAGRGGTGRLGQWLTGWLTDLLGTPWTFVIITAVIGVGSVLAFRPRWRKPATGVGTANAAS